MQHIYGVNKKLYISERGQDTHWERPQAKGTISQPHRSHTWALCKYESFPSLIRSEVRFNSQVKALSICTPRRRVEWSAITTLVSDHGLRCRTPPAQTPPQWLNSLYFFILRQDYVIMTLQCAAHLSPLYLTQQCSLQKGILMKSKPS